MKLDVHICLPRFRAQLRRKNIIYAAPASHGIDSIPYRFTGMSIFGQQMPIGACAKVRGACCPVEADFVFPHAPVAHAYHAFFGREAAPERDLIRARRPLPRKLNHKITILDMSG